MGSILESINEWIRELFSGLIEDNLINMFTDVNEKTGTIAAEVSTTPQDWNPDVFSMIRTLSENVIVPIAGIIITFVLCHELITMIIDRNSFHDFDTSVFFRYFFKMWVAVFIVTHTFDITMAVFDVAQNTVSASAASISGSTQIDIASVTDTFRSTMETMEIPELILLSVETMLVSMGMKIMSVIITVILYGRIIEVYCYCSIAPVPFATMTNREWGSIGNNYLRGLFALGFQGFFIMVCVGIYGVLVGNMVFAQNIHTAIFSVAAYTVILCFSLFKTGSLAKSVFGAH